MLIIITIISYQNIIIYHAFYGYVQFVDPVVERLNTKGCIRYKLCRAATKYKNGKHYRVCSN